MDSLPNRNDEQLTLNISKYIYDEIVNIKYCDKLKINMPENITLSEIDLTGKSNKITAVNNKFTTNLEIMSFINRNTNQFQIDDISFTYNAIDKNSHIDLNIEWLY
jgi:chromosome condensin MukBEF MukE localization factor